MNRRLIMFVLTLLPTLCVIGVPLAMQINIWRAPEPRWTIDADPNTAYWTCWEAAETLTDSIQPVTDLRGVRISPAEAQEIANRVIADQRGWWFLRPGIQYGSEPGLIMMTMPNNVDRLVWHRVLVTESDSMLGIGMADIVYVDARTGDPLLYVRDAQISEPIMACGIEEAMAANDLMQNTLPTLATIYTIIAGGIGVLFVLGGIIRRGSRR